MSDWSEELRRSPGEKIEADEKIEIEKDHEDLDPVAGRAHLKKPSDSKTKRSPTQRREKTGSKSFP